jgi:2-oxoglutarate dehydrogenase E2 component (dihydrolipoamide succinyltransferase)
MPTDVLMPQMGESIAEGTIVRWIKRVGDTIDKDEPLFEISTDKVDAEIPSPDEGVLLEIRVKEGDTVPVNTVVAVIGAAGERAAPAAASAPAGQDAAPTEASSGVAATPTGDRVAPASPDAERRAFASPVVRRLAQEHGIDLSQVKGTGASGRVTEKDVMAVVEAKGGTAAPASKPGGPATSGNVRVEKMSVMRKKIAEHMVTSARTSPHVYSAYEVAFGRIDDLRAAHKARLEADGVKLSYTAFIAKATADTLREFPFANASLDGDSIVYRNDINLGVAVALEQGLIVPVIPKADGRSTTELARIIQDLAERARSKHLKVEEVEGGTFTITNPGIFGGLWGLPILNQPQVAILAVGSIDKRAVVVDDAVVVRPMCHLTMGYDHRLIDGADGGRFLAALKKRLETFDEGWL